MANHKSPPLHITKHWNQYKPKGSRHEMHSQNGMCTCRKENIFFSRFTQKEVNKSHPKWFVTRVISHLVNSSFSSVSCHLFFLAQCVQIQKLFFSCCPSKEIILIADQQCQHLSIQFSKTQRFIHVPWTHTQFRLQRVLKQNRPPADTLDQTVRPFRVKKWLPCALWIHTEAMPRWPAGWAVLC